MVALDWTRRGDTRITCLHYKYKYSPVNRPCVQILAGRRLQSPGVQCSRHRVPPLQLPGFRAHIFRWLHRDCDRLNFRELIRDNISLSFYFNYNALAPPRGKVTERGTFSFSFIGFNFESNRLIKASILRFLDERISFIWNKLDKGKGRG